VSTEIYEFDGFRLEPAHRRLVGPGGVVPLTAKPFDALVHLVERAGEPVSRNSLLKAVWPSTIVEDNNLTQAIHALRAALGKEYIATLPGRGYQFVGQVRRVARDSGSPPREIDTSPVALGPPEPSLAGVVTLPPPAAPRWPRAAAAVVIVGLVGLVAFFGFDGDPRNERGSVLPNSIAVLPLVNLSPDPDNAYYAAGIHEEILSRLSKLKSLNVISRTSVLRYAENRPPIPEIARQLNVQNVLEGSVRFLDGRIRVAMQLIDGRSDRQLWAETYDGTFGDVFGAQSDIATNVAHAMSLEFPAAEARELLELPTGSSEAYAIHLRAWDPGAMAPHNQRDDVLLDQGSR
jgi:TolB-like protein/DNA-binding winged helix-turn-helix (wHTH) protein